MTNTKAYIIVFGAYLLLLALLFFSQVMRPDSWVIFAYFSVVVLGGAIIYIRNSRWWVYPDESFPEEWRPILNKEVSFYAAIDAKSKLRFEKKILFFLANYEIRGVVTSVHTLDKLLLAASSIIPTFHKKRWKYTNLKVILLYPQGFSFKVPEMSQKVVMEGLVGDGPLEGKMILSKEALRKGFEDETDNHNTAIHEFVHLIDKGDGAGDGIPVSLMRFSPIPRLRFLLTDLRTDRVFKNASKRIANKQTDIRPYGGTNKAEFLSVVSEYFFENPEALKEQHPDIHRLMEQIYRTPKSVQSKLSNGVKPEI